MLAVILIVIALIVVFKVTSKILKKHPYYNKTNINLGASKSILFIASLFFLTSYLVKSGADELDRMRTPSHFFGYFGGGEILGDIFSVASENGVDIDEAIGVSEMPADMRLMMDNVSENYNYSIWCFVLIFIAFICNVYGVMKTNKIIIWTSLTLMAAGLVISGRLAGACSFHLLNFSTSGLYNPYEGDTSKSLLIPFFTIVAAIIAIWCGVSGFKKSKLLVNYISSDNKPFVGKTESQPSYNPQPTPTYTQSQPTKVKAQDYKEKAKRLQEIKELYDMQALTQEEYEKMKHQILNP